LVDEKFFMAQKTVPPLRQSQKSDPRFVALLGEKLRSIRQQKFGSQEAASRPWRRLWNSPSRAAPYQRELTSSSKALAAKAGVAVQTVASAEASRPIRRSTALLLAQTLEVDARHSPRATESPALASRS
jgi:hypothetical protein